MRCWLAIFSSNKTLEKHTRFLFYEHLYKVRVIDVSLLFINVGRRLVLGVHEPKYPSKIYFIINTIYHLFLCKDFDN